MRTRGQTVLLGISRLSRPVPVLIAVVRGEIIDAAASLLPSVSTALRGMNSDGAIKRRENNEQSTR